MHKAFSTFAAAALLVGATATVSAQSETEAAAYLGIQMTPVGALPGSLQSSHRGMTISTQYGYTGFDGRDALNSFGLGADMPFRSGRVGVVAGYQKPQCDACDGHIMMAANWGRRIASFNADAAKLNFGLDASAGYARPEDAAAYSVTIGMPIALVPAGKGVQFTPYLTPRAAWGRFRVTDLGGDSGTALMLGGGVAVSGLMRDVGVNVGFQKTFIDGATAQYGLGLTWNR